MSLQLRINGQWKCFSTMIEDHKIQIGRQGNNPTSQKTRHVDQISNLEYNSRKQNK